jgi:DNA repair photolyase
LDVDLARILEPRAPRPDLRLRALQMLNVSGIDAGVICAPVLPGISDSTKSLERLVAATARAGGKYIFANSLFLKPCSASIFLPFLEKEFPQLAADYKQRFENKSFISGAYRRRISDLMAKLRSKYGITYSFSHRTRHIDDKKADPEQMALFRRRTMC